VVAHLLVSLGAFGAQEATLQVQIGKRIRSRRQALKLTQQQLARELHVTPQHISRLEAGQVAPSLKILVGISRKLGMSADQLLTGKGTDPVDWVGAIRAQPRLSANAKRHLIALIDELSEPRHR
jgi:transcriptional regulator with XRE-family HTH domain